MNIFIIVNQIGILAVIGVIGWLIIKLKIISINFKEDLSKFIIEITMPLLIFSTLTKTQFSMNLLKNSLMMIGITYVSLFILFVSGYISSIFLNLKNDSKLIYILHTTFGNIVFLGFPVIGAVYGEEGLFYATIFQLCADSLLWTLGIYSFNKSIDKQQLFKKFVNPNTIAFALGIMFMVLNIKLPLIFEKSFSDLGHTTIYLSMIYVGVVLSQFKIKNIYKKFHIFALSLNKMVLIPILLLYLINFLKIPIDKVPKGVIILEIATPAMVAVVILAKKYNKNEEEGIENLIVTTVLSIFTMPLIYWLTEKL